MTEDKTIKRKMKLLQKLEDYGVTEDKEAIGLGIEDQIKMNLTIEESKILIYLRECIKHKKGILPFYMNNKINNKEGNKENEQHKKQ